MTYNLSIPIKCRETINKNKFEITTLLSWELENSAENEVGLIFAG